LPKGPLPTPNNVPLRRSPYRLDIYKLLKLEQPNLESTDTHPIKATKLAWMLPELMKLKLKTQKQAK
jgi:hypothetical protein